MTELTHEGSPCAAASQPSSLAPHLRCPSVRPFALNTWENSPPPPVPGSDWFSLGSAPRGGWHPPHQALPPFPPTHCLCSKPHRTLTLSGLHSCASRQVLILSHLSRETWPGRWSQDSNLFTWGALEDGQGQGGPHLQGRRPRPCWASPFNSLPLGPPHTQSKGASLCLPGPPIRRSPGSPGGQGSL